LNDIWVLQRIGSSVINTNDSPKGLATLELQLGEGKAFGHGCCNRFTGNFTILENKIFFGPLASTKMACSDNSIETQYLGLLSGKPLSYNVRRNALSG
jgi:heat shock protein HslJ